MNIQEKLDNFVTNIPIHGINFQDYGQPTQHWEHWNRFYKAHSWPWSSEKCSECNCTKPEPKTNVDETIKKEEP